MNALSYFLAANLFLLLFYGCYHVLLRRNTFFRLNRAYLLMSVVLSVLLPLVSLPDAWFAGARGTVMVDSITLPAFSVGGRAEAGGLTIMQGFWMVYALGVMGMLVRLALNLRAVLRLIRSGTAEAWPDFTLVHLPDDTHPSFSFGRYLVLNRTDALTQPDALLRHEQVHIRQRHTADVLFIELIWAVFWPNPVLWFYKRALQEVHEFLADQAGAGQADYARQLVAYALNTTPAALLTPFVSVSTLKRRIVMLQKPQSRRRALLGYALVLPLAGMLTLCTQPDRDLPDAASTPDQVSARKPVNVTGEIYSVVEQQPEFPGGMEKLMQYLGENLKYPASAQKARAQGRVFVNFVVTTDGSITDVNILKGIGFGADEEAARVVSKMPRWQPGRQNGQAVNVRYNLPINFQMN